MAYVTDVAVTKTSSNNPVSPPGTGWNCVKNKHGENQDFNQKAGGDYIWVWYLLGSGSKGISGLRFITGKDAKAPQGWDKHPIDLNFDAGGEYIYLCSVNTSDFTYIRELVAGYGETVESAMNDFNQNAVVLRQDTNKGVGSKSKYVFLGYEFND